MISQQVINCAGSRAGRRMCSSSDQLFCLGPVGSSIFLVSLLVNIDHGLIFTETYQVLSGSMLYPDLLPLILRIHLM